MGAGRYGTVGWGGVMEPVSLPESLALLSSGRSDGDGALASVANARSLGSSSAFVEVQLARRRSRLKLRRKDGTFFDPPGMREVTNVGR